MQVWDAGIDKSRRFSVYEKSDTNKYSTGTKEQKIESELRFAEQRRIYQLRSGVMSSSIGLKTVRKGVCQNDESVALDSHASPSCQICLLAIKLVKDVVETFLSD